jgi:hypothetical protein
LLQKTSSGQGRFMPTSVRTVAMPLVMQRTGVTAGIEAPVRAAPGRWHGGKQSREPVGFRTAVWQAAPQQMA